MARSEVRYTLVADGPTDVVLMNHIEWLLRQHTDVAIQSAWADFSRLPQMTRQLTDKIVAAIALYPCDILCIHRDAEREPHATRISEIHKALAIVPSVTQPIVKVVPVRMQEAWLLFDERAIRNAVGNPRGKLALTLPSRRSIESLPDPKQDLYALLRLASGLSGRRLKSFRPPEAARLVADYIDDFTPLRRLPAFAAVEADIISALASLKV